MSSYMMYFMLQMIIGIIAICFGIKTISNTYHAIVDYKKKVLVCAKCGKLLTNEMDKCPKCKVRLK